MSWVAPRTWIAGEILTAALMNQELRDNLLAVAPVGSLHYYIRAATTAETLIDGFALEANGVAPLRATYAALNTLLSSLGYPFGAGNGSTTFTLPDLRGRDLISMASGGNADVDALGDSDGLAIASRTPKHNSTSALTLSGAPSLSGAPGGSFASDSHTHPVNYGTISLSAPTTNPVVTPPVTTSGPSATASPTIGTLAVAKGTLAVSGSVGPGGARPVDTPAYLVAGVWAVKT